MGKAKIAFQKVDGFTPNECWQNKALVWYQEIKGHWIFDIKMDGKFTRMKHASLRTIGNHYMVTYRKTSRPTNLNHVGYQFGSPYSVMRITPVTC